MPTAQQTLELYNSVWSMIPSIAVGIALWFITDAIKDELVLWRKRRGLINQAVISKGNWYEIDGVVGKVLYIGRRKIHLEDKNEMAIHIPIDLADNGAIRSVKEPRGSKK